MCTRNIWARFLMRPCLLTRLFPLPAGRDIIPKRVVRYAGVRHGRPLLYR